MEIPAIMGTKGGGLEMLEIGPCKDNYTMGFQIGQKFSKKIRRRLSTDLILQKQLVPFAYTLNGHHLIQALSDNNKKKFPHYWDELRGTAQGSGVPFLEVKIV